MLADARVYTEDKITESQQMSMILTFAVNFMRMCVCVHLWRVIFDHNVRPTVIKAKREDRKTKRKKRVNIRFFFSGFLVNPMMQNVS